MKKQDVITITAALTPEKTNQQNNSIGSAAPPVFTGSAGYTGGTAELVPSESATEPPITNRGAEITIPPENRSLLDWVAFTLKVDNPLEVLEVAGLSPSLFTDFQYGFSGYRKSLRFGNISVYYLGRDGMGCHLEMSGQGCRQFEGQFNENPWPVLFQSVLAAGGNFTRLDLAIDNVDGALCLEKVYDALQDHDNQVRSRFGEWRRILKGSFDKGEKVTGETIYRYRGMDTLRTSAKRKAGAGGCKNFQLC